MISEAMAVEVLNRLGVDPRSVNLTEFRKGVEVEFEHTNVVDEAARIALEHLREVPDYYARLELVEMNGTFSIRNGKAQWIRVADVLAIGPLMVAGGVALAKKRPLLGVLLGAMGIGTILFNARNWYAVERAKRLGMNVDGPSARQ